MMIPKYVDTVLVMQKEGDGIRGDCGGDEGDAPTWVKLTIPNREIATWFFKCLFQW